MEEEGRAGSLAAGIRPPVKTVACVSTAHPRGKPRCIKPALPERVAAGRLRSYKNHDLRERFRVSLPL